MDKYQHIVRWTASSHSHKEQFNVISDIKEQKPILMNYIAGSGTTYQDKDPSFDIVHLDTQTALPVHIETYHMNVDDANKNDKPIWR